jgi:hypothetical protein
MRNIATFVALSLTAPLLAAPHTAHASTDSSTSSYVIDLLGESQVADKEIDQLEGPEDFQSEDTQSPEASLSRALTTDSAHGTENTENSELKNREESQVELGDSSTNDEVEDSPQPEEENVPTESESPRQEEMDESSEDETAEEEETPQPETDAYTLLTDPLETEGFHVAGVTWEGTAPEQIDVRAYSNGEWTEWFNLEIDVAGEGNDGTDPIMAAGSNGIQVRASGEVLPDALDVHLMTGAGNSGKEEESEPREAEEQPEQGTELEPAQNAELTSERSDQNFLLSNDRQSAGADESPAGQLTSHRVVTNLKSVPFSKNIVSRTQWGAPRQATWRTQYASLKGAIVHHTDGTNSYTRSQAPNIVKGIWNYHTYTRGWGDIGYNFLIDNFGTVYEGRSGSVASKPGQMAVGAHAAPANTGSVGVSVLGSYTGSVTPSSTVLDTISEVIAWQFAMSGVNPSGKFTYRSSSGKNITTNAISGHRDISSTVCPGNIYSRLGTIRSSVASKMSQYLDRDPEFVESQTSGNGWPQDDAWSMGDFSGNGTTDLTLRNSRGHLLLYKGRGDNTFASPVQIGHGWNGFKELYPGVDFDGDSIPDVLAINNSNHLYLYPGDGKGRLKKRTLLGHGWSFEHLIVLQKGPGRNPAIAGITKDGTMRMYPTNGKGKFLPRVEMGRGYKHLHGAIAVGDWDSTGFSDVVNVTASGRLHYYADPTEREFQERVQIGRGWAGLTLLSGDSEGGHHDILTISPNGRLTTYVYAR